MDREEKRILKTAATGVYEPCSRNGTCWGNDDEINSMEMKKKQALVLVCTCNGTRWTGHHWRTLFLLLRQLL